MQHRGDRTVRIAGLRAGATLATAAAATLACAVTAPVGAQAAPSGTAAAQAVDVQITATTRDVPVLTPLLSRLDLSASTPRQTAPGTNGTARSAIALHADVPSVAAASTGAVVASATRSDDGTSGASTVDAASVGVLGTTVLTTGVITSSVTCPTGAAATATANAARVQVGGTTLVDGQVGQVPVVAAGLDGAAVRVAISSPRTAARDSASATGLLVTLTLQGTLSGTTTAVSVPLGQVSLADSSCATPGAASSSAATSAPAIQAISPASGPAAGGQHVVLTGTGFSDGTTVTFGGAPATGVTVVSPTSLDAVTPAHPVGPVSVVATNAAGSSAPQAYSYIAPSVTSVSPDQGPTAGGQSVTINGAGFTADAKVTIGGHPATGTSVNDAGTAITGTTPAGTAGPADVTVTNGDGSQAQLAHGYAYDAAPTVTGISPRSGPEAGGSTVTITGAGFVPGATTVSFGGHPASSVRVASSTTLTAVTPRGVGAARVEVGTPGGTSAAAQPYTYVAGAAGSGGAGELPFTGGPVAEWAGLSGWLLAVGVWLFVYGGYRRRAARQH